MQRLRQPVCIDSLFGYVDFISRLDIAGGYFVAELIGLYFKWPAQGSVILLIPSCYFFCGKKVTKKAARKGLHPLFGLVLLLSFGTAVASALYHYS